MQQTTTNVSINFGACVLLYGVRSIVLPQYTVPSHRSSFKLLYYAPPSHTNTFSPSYSTSHLSKVEIPANGPAGTMDITTGGLCRSAAVAYCSENGNIVVLNL